MSTYTFKLYSLDTAITSDPGLMTYTLTGEQWDWYADPTFEMDASATSTAVTISDTDADGNLFSDDSDYQVTTSDITVGGTTYPAGSMLMDEYEITLTDGVNEYRLVAVSIREYQSEFAYTDTIIGYTWDGAAPPAGTTLTYVSTTSQDYASMVLCFTPGTLIDTPKGPRPAENLRPGDVVLSHDGRAHPLVWTGHRAVTEEKLAAVPEHRPVRIRAGALAAGIPTADLVVSPQHRVLVQSAIAERISGAREVLVAARHLLGFPGIETDTDLKKVTYIHLFCRTHEVLIANGAATESFFPGKQALRALSFGARQRFMALYAGLAPVTPARPLLRGKQGRKLAERHAKHARPLQEPMKAESRTASDAA